MTSAVTESMIESRLKSIVSKCGISLKLSHSSVGWTLYKGMNDNSRAISGPIAFADSKMQIYQILKAMDWLLSEMKHTTHEEDILSDD